MGAFYQKMLLLGLLLLVLLLANICLGSVSIPIGELMHCLFSPEQADSVFKNIILYIRLPSALMAILAGAGLSLAGLLMQTYFRNPIAGPYVLGVSAGASAGVAIVLIAAPSYLVYFGEWGQAGAAALGAALVLLLLLALAWRLSDNATMLIMGLLFSAAVSSLVEILQFWASQEQLQRFVSWSMSGSQSARWAEIQALTPILAVSVLGSWLLHRDLNVLLLGENYARSMGLNYSRLRLAILGLTALLAGSITAFCGAIAFVGMGVPHLARWWLRTAAHQQLIFASLLIGANMLLFCQLISVIAIKGQILPLNAVCSLFGLPLVLWLIYKNKGGY